MTAAHADCPVHAVLRGGNSVYPDVKNPSIGSQVKAVGRLFPALRPCSASVGNSNLIPHRTTDSPGLPRRLNCGQPPVLKVQIRRLEDPLL
jgi:hypothetical protein